jgi:hypothetical protein
MAVDRTIFSLADDLADGGHTQLSCDFDGLLARDDGRSGELINRRAWL